ncbi:MAG: SOS response-associated peptidase [Gammaproteobacteria bacterium]|jgi:putative SOS response-associated peptidase YedK
MCGRYAFWSDRNQVLKHFGLENAPLFSHSYNIAPTHAIPVVRLHQGERELINCHWGLVPHWARDTKIHPINARAESLGEKRFFRDSFRRRRCLIPANGFYEWRGAEGRKQPYFFRLKDAELFAFAGLWDHWDSPEESFDSCTIITTGANKIMKPIHGRMPVILDPGDYDPWLEEGPEELLRPYAGEMIGYPVSFDVNSPANDEKELIEPVHG